MALDVQRLRTEFPILSTQPGGRTLHYLDNAATAQMPRAVIDAVTRHETGDRANVARGVHALAERATAAFEGARAAVADYLNASSPEEVAFTSGTTAAINLAAHGLGAHLKPGDEVVLSELEHHSNIVPWQMLRERTGIEIKVLPVTEDGRIDFTFFDRIVTKRCRLIALTHVSNVTGAVTDVAPVVEAARAVGALVLLDGAQAVPHGPVDVRALGVDLYAFSGHKMYGPNGIGALWGKRDVLAMMPPMLGGGGMIRHVTFARTAYADPPKRFEAGTPPIAQAVGLGAAAQWVQALDREAVAAHELRLTGKMLSGLATVPGLRVIGPTGLQGRRGVVSFAVEGVHPHDLCQWLNDRFGVALRGGHHCAEPLMQRFGLDGTSRASLAPYNTDADIDALVEGVADARRNLA
ncbi:MAG: SufS family cysteine desulfurase [Rhodospirillales bacterium]|nr:SufS family cysteine desulfurase [Rhodospirillales bacterium]